MGKTTFSERVKDAFTKGFSLNVCYQKHWDWINQTFRDLKLELYKHGPIITINEYKNVKLALQVTKMIKDDPKVRKLAAPSISSDYDDYEKAIERNVFLLLLRILPEYCRLYSTSSFINWITNKNNGSEIEELFSVSGTILSTDKEIDKIMEKVVKN